MNLLRPFALVVCTLLLWQSAAAALIEEVIELPVEVKDIYARTHQHAITVTVFRDVTRKKSPFVVINHGRATSGSGRAKLGRARYAMASKYFVSKGFAVFVPTRMGYGVTGGPDVEWGGPCSERDYARSFEAGATQVLAVIEHARARSYIDGARGVVIGQSVGGAVTLAVAAKNAQGVLAAINFAGGAGGNPQVTPERPCAEPALRRTFARYGESAQVPSLWLYSENDRYWGREKPRLWFAAFQEQGARADFVQLPPFRADGHGSFVGNPRAWKAPVEQFLSSAGLLK